MQPLGLPLPFLPLVLLWLRRMEKACFPTLPNKEDEVCEDQQEDDTDDDDIQAEEAYVFGIYSIHGVQCGSGNEGEFGANRC